MSFDGLPLSIFIRESIALFSLPLFPPRALTSFHLNISNLVSFKIFYFIHLDYFDILCVRQYYFSLFANSHIFQQIWKAGFLYKIGPKRRWWWVGGGWKDLVMRAEPSGYKTKAETRGDSGPAFLNLACVPGTTHGTFIF